MKRIDSVYVVTGGIILGMVIATIIATSQPRPTPTTPTLAEVTLQIAAERLERTTNRREPPTNAQQTNAAAAGTRIAHLSAELIIAARDFRSTDVDVTAQLKRPAASARVAALLVEIRHALDQIDVPAHADRPQLADAIKSFTTALSGVETEVK